MGVTLDGAVVRLDGTLRIEDAETVAGLLLADRTRVVDLAGAGAMHTAVVQVLLALRPALRGPAADAFVDAWVLPALQAGTGDGAGAPPGAGESVASPGAGQGAASPGAGEGAASPLGADNNAFPAGTDDDTALPPGSRSGIDATLEQP